MEWQKLYSKLGVHQKWIPLPKSAKGVWVDCKLWIGLSESDGFIPESMAAVKGTPEEISALVSSGLWEKVEGGYRMHDWDIAQEAVLRKLQKDRERQAEMRSHRATVSRAAREDWETVAGKIRPDKTRPEEIPVANATELRGEGDADNGGEGRTRGADAYTSHVGRAEDGIRAAEIGKPSRAPVPGERVHPGLRDRGKAGSDRGGRQGSRGARGVGARQSEGLGLDEGGLVDTARLATGDGIGGLAGDGGVRLDSGSTGKASLRKASASSTAGNVRKSVPAGTDADVVGRVFEYWRDRTGHALARPVPSRVRFIRSRLREGYTELELCEAIDGIANDPWGGRRVAYHDDLKYVLRDGTTVEKFRDLWRGGKAVRLQRASDKPLTVAERAKRGIAFDKQRIAAAEAAS